MRTTSSQEVYSLHSPDLASAMTALRARHRLFAEHFLVDLNQTAAARRAGYKNAKCSGRLLMRRPDVQRAIREAQEARLGAVEATAADVLNALRVVATMDIRVFFDDTGAIKPRGRRPARKPL